MKTPIASHVEAVSKIIQPGIELQPKGRRSKGSDGQARTLTQDIDDDAPFKLRIDPTKEVTPNRFENHVRQTFEALPDSYKSLVEKYIGSIDALVICHVVDIKYAERGVRIVFAENIDKSNMMRHNLDILPVYNENGELKNLSYVSSPNKEDMFSEEEEQWNSEAIKLEYYVPPSKALEAPPTTTTEARSGTSATKPRPSRVNKVQLGAWIDPEFKRSLLMVRVKDPTRSTESLIEEALNDLFEKYDVPAVPVAQRNRPGPKRSLG